MLVRPLLPTETGIFRDHLLRLDKDSRRLRFFRPVNDAWIEAYLSQYPWSHACVLVAFVDGGLCGSAEVIMHGANGEAEFGIAVEAEHRRRGIGKSLLAAALLRARNRGVRRLTVASLPENAALRALLAPYQPFSRFEQGVAEATLALQPADLVALMEDQRQQNTAIVHGQALSAFDGIRQAQHIGHELRELWSLMLERPLALADGA